VPSDDDLRRLTDDARRADAVASRRREQWLPRQAEDEGTFHGLLVDLSERQGPLALQTVVGRLLRGSVATLGTDFVALSGAPDGTILVPLTMVTAVSPEPGTAPTVGDRFEATTAAFAAVVADLAGDRPTVTLHTTAGGRVAGTLWSVGRDFGVVRAPAGDTYVPFTAVNDLTWR
jgi:hypothetical protein